MLRRFAFILLLLCGKQVVFGQVFINEICPANADLNYDPQFFNYSGWVELYNSGSSSVNVGGYFLSDKTTTTNKWVIPSGTSIPAKGFILIWCDEMNTGLHTNFSLDSDGEDVVLSNAANSLVDKVKFPRQYTNISYGRTSDGGSTWGHLVSPTPRTANNNVTATERLDNPKASLSSGKYSSSQTVTLSHTDKDAVIRYTTDGSEPNAGSKTYSSSIGVGVTTTIKAKAFKAGFLPSETEVKTYIISSRTFTLPIVSITTKPAYLWDDKIGIYVKGTNGIPGNCQSESFNWNQDWDRHAVFEVFEPNGEKRFDQDVDIRLGGACSRNNAQKSIVIKARDKYGKNTIDEKLFDSKPFSSYGGLILRNSGNDFQYTMFRDAFMQALTVGQMDIDYLAYEPAIFYLNGEYWGIQNMREKIDADYIETNYGIDKDDLDLGERDVALEGSLQDYNTYINTLQGMDRTTDAAYDYIDANIDIQEFINYYVTEIYCANTDWPGNNMKYWRKRSGGKWRWILWDLDFGFALYDGNAAVHPTLNFATDPNGPGWPNPPWSTLHFRLLLGNPKFRTQFFQTFKTALSTTFHPDRVIGFIDQFANRIRQEIPSHVARWKTMSVDGWNNNVQTLRNFAVQRNAFMHQHLADFFGIANDNVTFTISSEPVNAGGFALNGVSSADPMVEGKYLKGLPFSIEAVAASGYKFKEWRVNKREITNIDLITRQSSWKYFDQGVLPAATWMQSAFNDASWSQGSAELGYGDGDEQTVVSFGGNASNKFITTYFRRNFNVADLSKLEDPVLSIKVDDGAVIYLNGAEVSRVNMPQGAIDNGTFSNASVESDAYTTLIVPKAFLKEGVNVIAVEVHQINATSSDVSFVMDLKTQILGDVVQLTTAEKSWSDIAASNFEMVAVFEAVPVQDGIVINEISVRPSAHLDEHGDDDDWIELYNTSNVAIDIGGYFITDNPAIKNKYQIPSGTGKTVIQPGGYLLLWADEETLEGPLHVNFKLSADGEFIGLYQMVEESLTAMDEYTFDAPAATYSFSRIPNATGSFTLTTKQTPLAENILEVTTDAEEEISRLIVVTPNPTTGDIRITSPYLLDEVTALSITGRKIKSVQRLAPGTVFSLADASAGVYILQIKVSGVTVIKRVAKY